MNAPKIKRRRFLVDRQVQCALGLRIATHWLIFLLASLVITTVLRTMGSLDQANLWSNIGSALAEQTIMITVALALLPWFVHDSLSLSNRFAGPMVRLRSAIKALRQADGTDPIKFRNGDFWFDVAEEFNDLRKQVMLDRAELGEFRQLQATTQASNSEMATQKPANPELESTVVIPELSGTTDWVEPNPV
ncbi:MAG: hypothetical protein R3C53_12205 [Pirellulaceae bacterium]